MLHPRSRSITLDVKRLFAFIAIICFLIALLKATGWIFDTNNEESFLVGGLLAFSISWLYSDAPTQPPQRRPPPPPEQTTQQTERMK